MDLILWRHAEADDARRGEADRARRLTKKGELQAERMAAWLNQRLAPSTQVLASPARRCQQTAAALGRPVQTVAALGSSRSAEDLLAAVGWPDGGDPVLVVGHQPTLGETAALLLTNTAQSWAVKKGAVWWLRRQADANAGQTVLQAVQAPDDL
jgi:phosphohistidine phosphatase